MRRVGLTATRASAALICMQRSATLQQASSRTHLCITSSALSASARRYLSSSAGAAATSAATPASASAASATDDIDAEPINPEEYAARQAKERGTSVEDDEDAAWDEQGVPYRAAIEDPAAAALRARLLDASLPFVAEHGWSHAALRAGAKKMGLSTAVIGVLPRGPAELVEHVTSKAHAHMHEKLRALPLDQLSTSDKLYHAIRSRLEYLVPYLSQWPQALAILAQPGNLCHTIRASAEVIDDIWYTVGDTATDLNWYTKRALLSGVYASTELVLLTDRSAGQASTWSFLQRQLQQARSLAQVPGQAAKAAQFACNIAATGLARVAGAVPR